MNKISMVILTAICLGFSTNCYALAKPTHHDINAYILGIESSSLDATLNNYNMPDGIDTKLFPLSKDTVIDLIANGGASEDNPLRYANHYHNPIKSWDRSGYSLPGSVSTPMWIQQKNQGTTSFLTFDSRSWPDAREYFYTALTATSEFSRNMNFKNCFTSVGQCMHLVEDMSVPAHVRDESHAKGNALIHPPSATALSREETGAHEALLRNPLLL